MTATTKHSSRWSPGHGWPWTRTLARSDRLLSPTRKTSIDCWILRLCLVESASGQM
jgi:hypothetical protein